MAGDDHGRPFLRERRQEDSKTAFEKREKRRRIRKIQEAISDLDLQGVRELLKDDLDIDFQYKGQTCLQMAVKKGCVDICRLLILRGADVNMADTDQNNLLNMACFQGHLQTAELLMENGACLDAANVNGFTPLHTCVQQGHVDLTRRLLDAGCDPDIVNMKRSSPLHTAIMNHDLEMTLTLMRSGCDVNKGDEEMRTPLILAASLGHADLITTLMDEGADGNIQDRSKRTAVFWAAKQKYPEVLRQLINGHVDVDIATTKGTTPLLEAIENRFLEGAAMLIKAGCDLNLADREKQAPIHAAVGLVSQVYGDDVDDVVDLVRLLVKHGCDVNKTTTFDWSPLYQAASLGNLEICRVLLDGNADITMVTSQEDSVLHGAAIGNNVEVVRLLLDAGCDVNKMNKNLEHALFTAINNRSNIKILEELIASGSDVDHREKSQGQTPLHQAILQNFVRAALLLIDSGCNNTAANGRLETPLFVASLRGLDPVVERLLTFPDAKVILNGTKLSTIPIHAAVANNHPRCLEMLIKAGCNMNKMNEKALTPIMAAAQENRTVAAKILLMYGCDLNAHAKVTRLLFCCIRCEDAHPHFELEPLFLALTHRNLELLTALLAFYPRIPMNVVKNLSDVLRTSPELTSHYSPKQKASILALFDKAFTCPRSLQEASRAVIRKCLGSMPGNKVRMTGLSPKLYDYVTMTSDLNMEDVEEQLRGKNDEDVSVFGWKWQ